MKRAIFLLIILSCLTGCENMCSKEKIQSETSPDGKKIINTYLINCHATVDWSVIAELCENNKCKEIYNCYHENDSLVYWIIKMFL